ncbi:SDR family oxidoreductase [Prosthecochloris sp. N3]|uniref:SDR family oxidoreductase n=1 Tax=Prosthecochloris ethylica TaxID=2743976 RepID=A0ABR9XP55_9CHLB|nr:SDR family NAD(P)-dependent oxidoreductase [Prosthecochloris ethylica]MBF0585901.1 SDR family oxidoreductase [Prosthecochloris ethylica]MBF0635811.1 SDR family oxidoreductase [Prosthecochloris ethylica]MEC9486399.1 SDR family NAD(P)-dependent oxidoreductase [Prosthecochloris sp.]NUK47109.1 SDR family oxidoreductase [Prosthecochloris ethylica]
MRLSGRIALVTGAGGGIGSAVARCFAAEGAEVVLSDKTERQCRNVEREIVGAGGVARVVAADMMKPHEIAELFSGLEQLDILCTVAGGDCDPVADVTALDEDRIGMNLDLNLRSCMLCCREAARIMKPRQSGRIVTMSSLTWRGAAGQFSYAAAKGGIVSFVRSLAMALGPDNITVNALAPALVDVPLFERVLGAERWNAMKADAVSRYPLRRIARPEDVARAALFFASDDAAFLTGQVLEISGGARL